MNVEKLAILEAVLFTAENPVSLKKLATVIDLSPDQTKRHLEVLIREYEKDSHGFKIKEYDGGYIFRTKLKYSSFIKDLHNISKKFSLSQAALETLAIIVYKQPVTRAEIEKIRGVKVEKTLLTLTKYNLIQELGRKDTIGNPIVYGTTKKFLQHFDINNLSQLPPIENVGSLDK